MAHRARSLVNLELHERLTLAAAKGDRMDNLKPGRICLSTIVDVHQITRLFSPQALSVCSPLIFGAMVALGTVEVPELHLYNFGTQQSCLYTETTALVLYNVARHWSIGRALLGMY